MATVWSEIVRDPARLRTGTAVKILREPGVQRTLVHQVRIDRRIDAGLALDEIVQLADAERHRRRAQHLARSRRRTQSAGIVLIAGRRLEPVPEQITPRRAIKHHAGEGIRRVVAEDNFAGSQRAAAKRFAIDFPRLLVRPCEVGDDLFRGSRGGETLTFYCTGSLSLPTSTPANERMQRMGRVRRCAAKLLRPQFETFRVQRALAAGV